MTSAAVRIMVSIVLLVVLVAVFMLADITAKRTVNEGGVVVAQAETVPDLRINGVDEWSGPLIQFEQLKPGGAGATSVLLDNTGDEGTVTVQLLNLVDDPGAVTEPELVEGGGIHDGELSQYLDMLIWLDDGNGVYEGETVVEADTLWNIVAGGDEYDLGTLAPGDSMYLGIGWSLDISVTNIIHGDRCTFDIWFRLYELLP
jgi:hypothetical protein